MMIKKRLSVLSGVALGVVVAASVMAGPTTLKFNNVMKWGQTNGGGPFEAEPIGFGPGVQGLGDHGAAAENYLTFCIELNEHIGNNTTYNAQVNTAAVNGGVGGGNPDPLDDRTAFLYTAFVNGFTSLTATGFTYGQAASGEALQEVIWRIEEEKTSSLSGLAADIFNLANTAVAFGGDWYGKGIGNVRVLNLTDANGAPKQDQLMIIPLPSPALAIFAGLLVVGGVSMIRHRRLHV